jgi:hypothetical protein
MLGYVLVAMVGVSFVACLALLHYATKDLSDGPREFAGGRIPRRCAPERSWAHSSHQLTTAE